MAPTVHRVYTGNNKSLVQTPKMCFDFKKSVNQQQVSHPAWTLCVFWSFCVFVFFGASWFAVLFSPSGHMGFLIFGWWVWTAFCCLAWCVVYLSLGSWWFLDRLVWVVFRVLCFLGFGFVTVFPLCVHVLLLTCPVSVSSALPFPQPITPSLPLCLVSCSPFAD